MKKTTPQEMQGVLKLDGPARFAHFVKRVADEEQVWSLYSDGWLMMEDGEQVPAFPLWPAREYAELCATGQWQGAEPRSMELDYLMTDLGPRLEQDGTLLGIFPTPGGQGVTIPYGALVGPLSEELDKY